MMSKFLEAQVTKCLKSTASNEELLSAYYEYCRQEKINPLPKSIFRALLKKSMLYHYDAAERHDIRRGPRTVRGFLNVTIIPTKTKIMETTTEIVEINNQPDIFNVLGVERTPQPVAQTTLSEKCKYETRLFMTKIELHQARNLVIDLEKKIAQFEKLIELRDELERMERAIENEDVNYESPTKAFDDYSNDLGSNGLQIMKALSKKRLMSINEISEATKLNPWQVSSWYYWQDRKEKGFVGRRKELGGARFNLFLCHRGEEAIKNK